MTRLIVLGGDAAGANTGRSDDSGSNTGRFDDAEVNKGRSECVV